MHVHFHGKCYISLPPPIPSPQDITMACMNGDHTNGSVQHGARGTATVLAIGTAVPPNFVEQSTYPDSYFRVTNSEHMVPLKERFRLFCEKSMVKKRHACITEEMLKENPCLVDFMGPSLDARRDIMAVEVPRLARASAAKAMEEWGGAASEITHLVFATTCSFDMPGPDVELAGLLGLRSTVKRLVIHLQGCFVGATLLRVAKDLAENNSGARVLAVSVESMVAFFRGPSADEAYVDQLVGQALFGDGSAAVVVGSGPFARTEKPVFEIVSAAQTIVPDTRECIRGELKEAGVNYRIRRELPAIVGSSIGASLKEAFGHLGLPEDWNSMFWMVHPGGPTVLDSVESNLGLHEKKLRASRRVLREYGNMSGASVLFVLDEMRRMSAELGSATTGEGAEWGVLVGLGPGITLEMAALRSVAIAKEGR